MPTFEKQHTHTHTQQVTNSTMKFVMNAKKGTMTTIKINENLYRKCFVKLLRTLFKIFFVVWRGALFFFVYEHKSTPDCEERSFAYLWKKSDVYIILKVIRENVVKINRGAFRSQEIGRFVIKLKTEDNKVGFWVASPIKIKVFWHHIMIKKR